MYAPKEVEEKMLNFWKEKEIFQKLMKKNRGKKRYSFIDGPITANNPMGVHHAWGRTYKDVYQRFKAMQGYDQRYQNGFDCQGLWLEVETEKELGFNSKRDIEDSGLDNFSKACRARVEKFFKVQTEQSIRLGQWMDWGNDYFTMSDTNIEYIWRFLKKCHEKSWLYKGIKILPWCIRCGTSSSKHEMSDEGYAELTHLSVYVKAKIKGKDDEYLLAWTTTEWTLSSNVALAVNSELDYSQVKVGKEIFYLSEATLKRLKEDYIVLNTLKGSELVGLEYESFYPGFEVQKEVKHKVIPWEEVGEGEGTGIVHIAPTCGAEDYELGKKIGLNIIKPALDEYGNYYEGFGWQTGKNVKNIKKEVVEDLRERGILYKEEMYTHRYPICWRCKEELIFRMDSSWFISCDEIRSLMKKAAKKVNWYPEHVGKLMQVWLDNMEDWNISRKRYWGLPLMFYECNKCKNLEIIGTIEELKNKAVDPKKVDRLPELHRPWIDEIKIKCSCGEEVERIPEIGDCWLDAGIVPFSTLKYYDDKEYWKRWFPADLEIEMRAQVRLWFYAQLFMAVTLENTAPYKNIFAYEEVRDEKGEAMHKSKGNAIWFDEAVEKMGADVMRWIYTKQNPQFNLNFGYTEAKEVQKILNILFNLSSYLKIAIKANNSKIGKTKKLEVEDKWILSKFNSLVKEVVENFDDLKPHIATKQIEWFFMEDLSRKYIQYIRERVQDSRGKNNKAAIYTLYTVYFGLLKLLCPITPFLIEWIYQDLFKGKEESIHLFSYPKSNKKLIDKGLEKSMELAVEIIQKIFAEREKEKIGVRWPLKKVVVKSKDHKKLESLKELISRQTNIREIELKEGTQVEIKLEIEFDEELEREGYARETIRRVQDLRKKLKLKKEDGIRLCIISNYDLGRLSKEIKDKVGAKELYFIDKSYKEKEVFKIKNKDFEIKVEVV